MGVLVCIAVVAAIVALAIKSIKRQEAAAQEAAWAEEIEQKKEAERLRQQQRLEEERLQQQQRLEDAGLSESCLQFAQRMKEHPMIVEEGQKLLQEAVSMLQRKLNDAVRNETDVYFSFSVDALGVRCDSPGSYAFTFASHGVSELESSQDIPVRAKTAGIGWALWRQINEPLQNAVPALTIQNVEWHYAPSFVEYRLRDDGTLQMKGVLKQGRFMKL